MAEIVTIPDKIKTSDIPDSELNTIGKFSKKVIHHNAGPPTAADDTGLGYAAGSIWVDSTNGDVYSCTASTAEDATWINMEGDDVNPPFVLQGTNSGWTAGGTADFVSPGVGGLNFITQWAFASDIGSGTDWGDLVTSKLTGANTGSARSTTEAFVIAGYSPHGGGFVDTISKYTFASPGNATDAGEFIGHAVQDSASAPDGTNTFVMGGTGPPPGGGGQVNQTTVTKLSMTSPYPQSDNGELSAARYGLQGASDTSFAYSSGGAQPSNVDIIERFPFAATSGTFSDVGELTTASYQMGVCSGPTHALIGGGRPPTWSSQLDRYAYVSSGNGADVGETSPNLGHMAGSNGPAYGYFVGGNIPGASPTGANTTNATSRMAWSATSGGSTDCGEIGGANHAVGVTGAMGSEN